jgi:hypothetical protein
MRKRWIIAGIVLLLALGAAYTGYWFWLARTFAENLALWIDQQRAMGYRLSYAAGEPRGYPLAIDIALSHVSIDSPAGEPAWRVATESTTLSLAPWAPLSLRIGQGSTAAAYSLQWAAGSRDYALSIEGMDLTLELSSEGAPPAVRINGRSAAVSQQGQAMASLTEPSGRVDFQPSSSDTQSSAEFLLSARGIAFAPQAPSDATVVETYDWLIAGQVKGPVPLAPLPTALAAWSNEGGNVELTQFNANWEAKTTVSGDGTVALDQRLQPVGAFSAVVRGYNDAVDAAVAHGLMTAQQGTAVKLWLAARAEKDAQGLKVKLPLTIQDGFVSMGPIKLAQVPHIAWD